MSSDRPAVVRLRVEETHRGFGERLEDKRAGLTLVGIPCELISRDVMFGGHRAYHRITWLRVTAADALPVAHPLGELVASS